MNVGILLLQVAALVFLGFAAFKLFAGPNRPDWGWFGLFLALLSLMIYGFSLHPIGLH